MFIAALARTWKFLCVHSCVFRFFITLLQHIYFGYQVCFLTASLDLHFRSFLISRRG